jgi:hypothetical protein
MNKLNKLISAVALASIGSVANAGFFQIDTGNSAKYDGVASPAQTCGDLGIVAGSIAACPLSTTVLIPATLPTGNGDADSRTGQFEEFGFSLLLATSIYEIDTVNGGLTGSFYDTNISSELAALGINTSVSGLALDGATTVELYQPNTENIGTIATPQIAVGEADIDALSPLAPPLTGGINHEGFGLTWDLQVEYHFDGSLTGSGPQYTGGYFNVIFNDFAGVDTRTVFAGTVTGSSITLANLDLFMDITTVEPGFLFFGDNGSFVDIATYDAINNPFKLSLDTNVTPPIPEESQLLQLIDGNNNDAVVAVRQAHLDGSIVAREIPEPSSIALLGLGLLGLAGASRRKAK